MDIIFKDYQDIVSVEDIMRMLNLGKSSVYTLLRTNQIYHIRVGKKYIIPKQAVVDFVNGVCYNDTG
jgi:excisionase family DNA binding protein